MIETIETDRLVLRAFRPADIDEYGAICADAEVMKYLGPPKTREDRPADAAPGIRGSELKAQQRYREAKATKRRGKDGRKSECFRVPLKRRNQPKGPRGGK